MPGHEARKVGLPSPLSQTSTVSTQEEGLGSRRPQHLAAGRQAATTSPTAQLTEEEPEAREGNHLPREGHFLECDWVNSTALLSPKCLAIEDGSRNVVIPHNGELRSLCDDEGALEGLIWSNLQDAPQSEKSKVKDSTWVEKGLNRYLPGSCSELNCILPKDMSKS